MTNYVTRLGGSAREGKRNVNVSADFISEIHRRTVERARDSDGSSKLKNGIRASSPRDVKRGGRERERASERASELEG